MVCVQGPKVWGMAYIYIFILTLLSTMEVSKFNRMKPWHVAFRQKKIEARYLLYVQRYSS